MQIDIMIAVLLSHTHKLEERYPALYSLVSWLTVQGSSNMKLLKPILMLNKKSSNLQIEN